ncbi:MAG TPA: hypothetical protein P5230_00065 [Candidatus Magasanikbacteria bacterium]|nr:hypothetical protein [Candidatus Magasanikbacteria bacterium]
MFKKILVFLILFLGLTFSAPALAKEDVNLYFFWGKGCPHCAKEEELLKQFQNQYSNLRVYDFEIYTNYKNMTLLQKTAEKLGARVDGVPFTIIGDKYFSGFLESMTPAQLAEKIEECGDTKCPDSVGELVGVTKPQVTEEKPLENKPKEKKIISVPVLGEIDAMDFSLPALTLVIGVLDGFNPCAMWTLIFLISLLLGMQNRKRMFILGSAFIISSATVYFMFMAAWLNLVLFLGFIFWVRLAIAAFAVGGGILSLREYWKNKDGACKVTGGENKQKTFNKLKELVHHNSFWFALGGIILLAGAVNLVELICSAGFPAIYTQVLALNHLPKWEYYLYLLGYVFFFMLDDLIVFFAAMITLKMTALSGKYSRYSNLIGGLLMVIIGILLIFKPEWLTLVK